MINLQKAARKNPAQYGAVTSINRRDFRKKRGTEKLQISSTLLLPCCPPPLGFPRKNKCMRKRIIGENQEIFLKFSVFVKISLFSAFLVVLFI